MTVIFDGMAFGVLLFLMGVGLSITLGLMNVVNLAHGSVAMLGGYGCVTLMHHAGLPFGFAVALASMFCAAVGWCLERVLFRRVYGASALDQVLLSLGLMFLASGAAHYGFGTTPVTLQLPEALQGQWRVGGVDIGVYRLTLIVLGIGLSLALHQLINGTRWGAQVRAITDHAYVARGLGVNVDAVFAQSFALGSGLAGLGGALSVELLSMEPGFATKYLVYFLIVATLGQPGHVRSTLAISICLGIGDSYVKYALPELGSFVIYVLMLLLLLARPTHLFSLRR